MLRILTPTSLDPCDTGEDGEEARAAGAAAWARCEALTAGLAGELAEQLRLILEPTVASRLAGDFRSGAHPVLLLGASEGRIAGGACSCSE